MRLFSALAVVALLAATPVLSQSSDEVALYQVIRNSSNIEELEVYLKSYPKGAFADIVRKRITAINDARAKEQAKEQEKKAADANADQDKKKKEEELAVKVATMPDPSVDEVKAMLASYYTAANFARGSTLVATWKEVKIFPKEIMQLSKANYPEYGKRKEGDTVVASWKVHLVVDLEIVESPTKRQTQHEDRELRMIKNDAGEWVYRWGGY